MNKVELSWLDSWIWNWSIMWKLKGGWCQSMSLTMNWIIFWLSWSESSQWISTHESCFQFPAKSFTTYLSDWSKSNPQFQFNLMNWGSLIVNLISNLNQICLNLQIGPIGFDLNTSWVFNRPWALHLGKKTHRKKNNPGSWHRPDMIFENKLSQNSKLLGKFISPWTTGSKQ